MHADIINCSHEKWQISALARVFRGRCSHERLQCFIHKFFPKHPNALQTQLGLIRLDPETAELCLPCCLFWSLTGLQTSGLANGFEICHLLAEMCIANGRAPVSALPIQGSADGVQAGDQKHLSAAAYVQGRRRRPRNTPS